MNSIVVVAPLKYGTFAEARALVEQGPPFDPERTRLARHEVFLTGNEAIFYFEGDDAQEAVQELVGETTVWRAALAWRRLLAGRPRVAESYYDWRRLGLAAAS